MAIRHTFSSPKADGGDATLVRPSDWNASHDDGGLAAAIDVVSNVASNAISVANAASNAASIVSNALSVEIGNRISADDALSNAISVVSALVAIGTDTGLVDADNTSQPWDILVAGTNITFTELADGHALQIDATAGAGSVTSDELSIVSAQAASAINVVSNAVSVVSQALSVLSQATSVADAALSVRIDTQSQNISTLSQNVSTLSQTTSVAQAALSVRIDTQSQSISVISQQVSVLSQGMSVLSNAASNALSVANAASQAASVVSQALSVETANRVSAVNLVSNTLSNETSNRLSADAALSVRIDTQSQSISVISQQVSLLSQGMSVLSNVASNAVSIANAASNAASIVSQAVSVVSAYLDQVALVDADGTSQPWDYLIAGTNVTFTEVADGHGLQIDATAGAGSVTSAEVQAVSAQAASALSQAISVFTLADQVLQSNINDISANLSFVVSNQASISAAITSINLALSNETSARIAADDFISSTAALALVVANNAVSQVSALEVRVSALSGQAAGTDIIYGEGYETTKPWEYIIAGQNVTIVERGDTDGGAIEISVTTPTTVVVQGAQTISVAALANISGLVAAVSTGGLYRMDAMVLINRAAAQAQTRLGLTFPSMTVARGYIRATLSAVQGLPSTTTEVVSSQGHFVPFNGNSASGSVIVSTISAATLLSNLAVYQGLFLAAANGNIQLQIAASTSAGTGLTVLAGSYMQVFRLA